MPREKLLRLTPWLSSPISSRLAYSSVRAIGSGPVSRGRSPRLSMNADTAALACSSSPAMNTSSGRFPALEPEKAANGESACRLGGLVNQVRDDVRVAEH